VRIDEQLKRIHQRARQLPALHRLAVISRILLALAFVPTALVKVQGMRFTSISTSTPIGYFFEAMFQSGMYWRFLGWSQLIAGVLLLVPRTAPLGALLFFPIILNIFVITVSLHFTGTPVITGLMLLACVFLLCWDYHRFAPLLWNQRAVHDVSPPPQFPTIERVGYVVGAAASMGVLFWTRGLAPGGPSRTLLIASLSVAAIAGLMVVLGWVRAARATAPVR
jgi:uncharacterized membrane protein YphA (DoxX/SURF4 family)